MAKKRRNCCRVRCRLCDVVLSRRVAPKQHPTSRRLPVLFGAMDSRRARAALYDPSRRRLPVDLVSFGESQTAGATRPVLQTASSERNDGLGVRVGACGLRIQYAIGGTRLRCRYIAARDGDRLALYLGLGGGGQHLLELLRRGDLLRIPLHVCSDRDGEHRNSCSRDELAIWSGVHAVHARYTRDIGHWCCRGLAGLHPNEKPVGCVVESSGG